MQDESNKDKTGKDVPQPNTPPVDPSMVQVEVPDKEGAKVVEKSSPQNAQKEGEFRPINYLENDANKTEIKEPVKPDSQPQEMGKKFEENKKEEEDEEMIDTTVKKNQDVEMEEAKDPQMSHKQSMDTYSEMLKSETNELEKSEMSEAYDIDPFFGRTVSLDAIKSFDKLQQRPGRSESIRNPILTSFWKMNESSEMWKKIKPDKNYYKLEERGFTRHLMLEGKYNEALQHLQEAFPDILAKECKIKVAINCLKLVNILQNGEFTEAITFGQENLTDYGYETMPAVDPKGNY